MSNAAQAKEPLFGPEDERLWKALDWEAYNKNSVYNVPGFRSVHKEVSHGPVTVSGTLPKDLDLAGRQYIEAIYSELRRWLSVQDPAAPIGVPFSGGIDSGAILLCLYKLLLNEGQSPARMKAFTLSVDSEGQDMRQALEFLSRTNLEMLGETIDVASSALDPLRAVGVIEDYKPLDVECATVNLALLAGIRERYPDWRLLVDGDGGDENLKDYPIEENTELTIRSVVNNRMLYQEGWGVDSIKHSLTYSGGYSRACVRSFACAREYGFDGFSPYTRPSVIAVAEAIPFADDEQHRAYDADAVHRFWLALVQIHRVMARFRGEFVGKVSPVHFFWGSFDLAVTRFSGRTAPPRAGADRIQREAYSHEVISAGFWPGNGGFGAAAFYCYAAPVPPGMAEATIRPPFAGFDTNLGEFLLRYDAVREQAEPEETVLDFLQSSYEVAADLAQWDRAALERRS